MITDTETPQAPTSAEDIERMARLGSATYSPEDNKLRLYPSHRLDTEDYNKAKAAGFRWAPKQDCFFTTWDPDAEDLLVEWCGEIDDEDKSLAERAEERADRFRDYSASRLDDAQSARAAVSAIADNPFGQPILVGHHSEKRARRDAEKIQAGMDRAVRAWETSEYWKHRAARAIAAAKYKERPDVRARRIKKLESERRGAVKHRTSAQLSAKFWRGEMKLTKGGAPMPYFIDEEHRAQLHEIVGGVLGTIGDRYIVDTWTAWDLTRPPEERYKACPEMTVAEIQTRALANCARSIARWERWIAHYDRRLEYERAMLAADAFGQTGPEVGGAVRCWCSQGAEWTLIQKVNKVSVTLLDNWGNGGADFTRTIPFDQLKGIMTKAQVDEARAAGRIQAETKRGFHLLKGDAPAPAPKPSQPKPEDETAKEFRALKETAQAGVQVVSAPQLFPTPPELAERVIDEAVIESHHRVLEPSAGTGALVHAVLADGFTGQILAIECNGQLVDGMRNRFSIQRDEERVTVIGCDFLAITPQPEPQGVGQFDRIVMNPPFERGADLKHMKHAFRFLKDGGRMVAICAQRAETQEWAETVGGGTYEPLPDGSFSEQGTNVRTALVVIDR